MIIVIGAGIAGLSLAHQLQNSGAQVTVIEAGGIAHGASGVATSYLEPRLGDTPMRIMEREALSRWADYAAMLEEGSGLDVGFRSEGQLRVSTEEYLPKLEKDLRLREREGGLFERLTAKEVHQLEPELSDHIVAGAFLPGVCWVTGKVVCAALERMFLKAGGVMKKRALVSKVSTDDARIYADLSDASRIEGDKLVLCTGMGANHIEGIPADIPQSRPVRGVNLVADMSRLSCVPRHLIKHHRGNLCPRADGRLIIGTTYEADEYSLEVADHVVELLYANAEPILPCVRDLPLLDIHAGIRAKVGDGLLRLGRSSQMPNLYYSLSHAGAGFLRAPVIGEELAQFVLEGRRGKFIETMTVG